MYNPVNTRKRGGITPGLTLGRERNNTRVYLREERVLYTRVYLREERVLYTRVNTRREVYTRVNTRRGIHPGIP